jgi:hypothetical protein
MTHSADPGIFASDGVGDPDAVLGLLIAEATKKLLAAERQPLRNPDLAAFFKAGGLV